MHKRSTAPTALFALDGSNLPFLFPADVAAALAVLVDIDQDHAVTDFADAGVRPRLPDVEILITGWGCPLITPSVLDTLPRLRAILHTGGTVKKLLTPEVWERGIAVSTAAAANALPVAEYTLGMILLLGKDVFAAREDFRTSRTFAPQAPGADIGNAGRRVGIIGASRTGRRVIELLRPFDFDVLLHDPYVGAAEAEALGVRAASLEELLAASSLVSVHAPATAETHHLLDAARLALLPDGAALINTARGSLVDTDALVKELVTGRIRAVLDVTEPEPLPADSALYRLPNVFLTPHIAGSMGNELRRLGLTAVREVERLLAGRPLAHRVEHAQLARTA
ncbi:hydroxyacid dehydrogenase [Streptomyces sp. MP131-18]|uniref:hydroxyacid dehydrogenase n=1 Tax=Streptomyces sp. MP131-18 TaxID=1857892 RepID=UPI00097CB0F9|nr:hydroxyacid dehydrogenase [Streptomyces sp. MP131-18]ONK10524.1 (S)-sulfolactate dehydrogenase [Streptomyces sp. MP131-18]